MLEAAEVESCRSFDSGERLLRVVDVAQPVQDCLRALAGGDEADEGCLRSERLVDRKFVVLALRGHNDQRVLPDAGGLEVQGGDDQAGVGMAVGVPTIVHDDGAPAQRLRQRGEGADHGGPADHHEVGLRQKRLHEQLDGPLALALHGHEADAVVGPGFQLLRRPQQHELGLPGLQRLAGLADHDRLRTGTAQPAADVAGGGDDGLIPRLRRRGGPTPHHGGQGEWLAPSGQILAQLHKVFSHRSPPPARS